MSSNRLEDGLAKIQEYLDSGKISLAESSLNELEESETSEKYPLKLKILRTMYFLEVKQPKKSKEIIQPLLNNLEDYTDSKQIEILALDARVKVNMSEFMKAEIRIDQILDKYDDLKQSDQSQISYIHPDIKNLQGLISSSKGDYHLAMDYFDEAGMEYRKQNRLRQRGTTQFNHGRILGMLGNYDRAIVILEEAAKIFKEVNHVESLASTYEQLIKIHEIKNDRDGVYTYKQLRQNLKDKLEFQRYKTEAVKQKDRLNSKLTEANEEIQELQQEIFELKLELNSMSSQDTDTSLNKEVNKQKLEEYEGIFEEKQELEQELSTKTREIEELQAEMRAYEHELSQIVETKQNLAQEMVKSEMLQADKEELQNIIDQLEQEKAELEAGLKEAKEDVIDEERIEQLESKLDDQLSLIEKLRQEKSELGEQLESVSEKSQEDSDDDQIEKLENKIDTLVRKNNRLRNQNNKLDKQVVDLKQQIQDITSLDQTLSRQTIQEDKINRLESKINDLEQELVQKNHRIEEFKAKISEQQIDTSSTKESTVSPTHFNQPDQSEPSSGVITPKFSSGVDTVEPKPQHRANPLIPGSSYVEETQEETTSEYKSEDLDELLASDKLIESIYNRLQSLDKVKLRILAMQLGSSQEACKKAVEKLDQIDAIDYDSDSGIISLS